MTALLLATLRRGMVAFVLLLAISFMQALSEVASLRWYNAGTTIVLAFMVGRWYEAPRGQK